jgi:hypothetical protein|tara:strand:- start:67 stop:447 length:381 start_codon:yes stop_codon:yes gene_type:complete
VFLFGIGSQLLGQDVYDTPEEVDREISKQEQREVRQNLAQEKMNKHSWVERTWMGVQDAEWKKFESAHRRAHQKLNEHPGKKVRKKYKQKRIVTLFVVGGLSYYIGYEMGKDKHKGKHGWDKKPIR